jgi:phosphatidate cytidylyltransferase
MLRTRVLSAIVMIPIVAAVLYLGGWWFVGAILLVAGLAAVEFYGLLREASLSANRWLGLGMIATLIVAAGQPAWKPWLDFLFSALLLFSLVWHMLQGSRPSPGSDWVATAAGALYLGWLGSRFVALRMLPDGLWWVALALLSTWITDSGAYFVGRRWGRRKLSPRLSPKKTWEGAAGGWIVGVALTPLVAWAMGLSPWHGLAIGALVATAAPFGDLAESMFKRQVGAKDSSQLIPGHGGMLDRIDSLLFVVPLVYYYVLLVV